MKIRESGMPDEKVWETFFNVESIFSKLEFDDKINDAVEFGAGYGTFSIPASKIIRGTLYAFDIDELMIEILSKRIRKSSRNNIQIIHRDIVSDGTGLEKESVDYVMLFNILHAEDPQLLLNESYRILKENGKAGIIHWIYSKETPRGPSLDIRPTEDQCMNWLMKAGFELKGNPVSLPPYHYGIIGFKK